ncbi:MAG: ETC complex I subunit [Acetobacteraceae bacterium]
MAITARIFRPPRSAMQAGWVATRQWVLEFTASERQRADPLMGWIGEGNTQTQVQLRFDTREEAIAYADKAGLHYEVETPPERRLLPKVYADNFRYDRRENWTH